MRRRNLIGKAKSLRFLLLTAFINAYSSVTAHTAETLKLGFSGASAAQLAGYLAVDQKLFDIYGVNVELTQSAGTIRALHSGSLHVAIVGGGQALNAYVKGVEVRIISGLVNTVPFQLWAKPELSQLKDLKGKLIANTPPGTSLNLANHILLIRAGLDPLRDGRCWKSRRHRWIGFSEGFFTGSNLP
jgi:ABC-type nitrate/sulfonate/bicarbonate transport system substrate-binding protein